MQSLTNLKNEELSNLTTFGGEMEQNGNKDPAPEKTLMKIQMEVEIMKVFVWMIVEIIIVKHLSRIRI